MHVKWLSNKLGPEYIMNLYCLSCPEFLLHLLSKSSLQTCIPSNVWQKKKLLFDYNNWTVAWQIVSYLLTHFTGYEK